MLGHYAYRAAGSDEWLCKDCEPYIKAAGLLSYPYSLHVRLCSFKIS